MHALLSGTFPLGLPLLWWEVMWFGLLDSCYSSSRTFLVRLVQVKFFFRLPTCTPDFPYFKKDKEGASGVNSETSKCKKILDA